MPFHLLGIRISYFAPPISPLQGSGPHGVKSTEGAADGWFGVPVPDDVWWAAPLPREHAPKPASVAAPATARSRRVGPDEESWACSAALSGDHRPLRPPATMSLTR